MGSVGKEQQLPTPSPYQTTIDSVGMKSRNYAAVLLVLVAFAFVSGTIQVRAVEQKFLGTAVTQSFTASASAAAASTTDDTVSVLQQVQSSLRRIQDEAEEHRSNSENTQPFCQGMPMTMFMDGFHWSLLGNPQKNNESSACLNYLVPLWILNEKTKFHCAMLVTFLFSMLAEALSALRGHVLRRFPSDCRKQRAVVLTAIYTMQAFIGYVIMFVAMMFSIELLLSVAMGLACGNALFMRLDSDDDDDQDGDDDERIQRSENVEETLRRRTSASSLMEQEEDSVELPSRTLDPLADPDVTDRSHPHAL